MCLPEVPQEEFKEKLITLKVKKRLYKRFFFYTTLKNRELTLIFNVVSVSVLYIFD